MTILEWLEARLRDGEFSIGQVRVCTGFILRHVEDVSPAKLFTRPEDAREIAKYDDAGAYRPLKTALDLRRGWELRLASAAEVRLAMDFFYPAAIGTWIAFEQGFVSPVDLRDTLGRQTGMYRITRHITDEQADVLIRERCSGCLRRQLWQISAKLPSPFTESKPGIRGAEIPILCVEACNLLVADCRPVAKRNLPASRERG